MLLTVIDYGITGGDCRRARRLGNRNRCAVIAAEVIAVPDECVARSAGRIRDVYRSHTATAAVARGWSQIQSAHTSHRHRRRVREPVKHAPPAARTCRGARRFADGDGRAAVATVMVAIASECVTRRAGRIHNVYRSHTATTA